MLSVGGIVGYVGVLSNTELASNLGRSLRDVHA